MKQENIPTFNKTNIPNGFTGKCRIVYDYSVYEGCVVKGLAEGQGKMTWSNGDVYEGNWKDGKREGRGTITWSNGAKYDGDWKDGKMEGKGKYTYSDGTKYDGDWKDGKMEGKGFCYSKNGYKYEGDYKNDKIVKKRSFGKTKNTKLKQTKMFYQINEYDNSKTIKPEEYKILRTINQQNKFINNKQDIIPNEHIKISYEDHGTDCRVLKQTINKELFTNILNTDTKSFYISSNACHGGFYDENKTTLFDIVKEQIKDKDCIGFVSLVKQEYSNTTQSTINDKGETGTKRMPINKQGVNVEDVYYNKDKYFEYYCIINEKNKETGLIEQNIYKIPSQLCYWREDLIEQKDKTYGNKFIAALEALKRGQAYNFFNDVTFYVDESNETTKNIPIPISGELKKVEIQKNNGWFTPTTYEIREVKNEQSTKRTKTTTKKQQNNIG